MTRPALPFPANAILALASRFVPRSRRAEWLREWRAELSWARRRTGRASTVGASLGSLPDAFWIRTHEWSPEMLLQDVRFALRTHRRRPGFLIAALATLALGIGATTALFSVVNGVLLAPLPYPEPDRLVRLYGFNEARGTSRINLNPMDLVDVRDAAESLVGLAWATSDSVTLTAGDEPLRLQTDFVAADYFGVLGVKPLLGRFFLEEENDSEAPRVVVLSEALWRDRLGADPAAVGRTIDLSGRPHVVIGVVPGDFAGPFFAQQTDLWMTWPFDAANPNRGGHFMRAIARLAPEVGIDAAQEEIDAIAARIGELYGKPGRGIEVVPLAEAVVGETRPVLLILLSAVAFVLAIVCANLAGLLLTRAAGRRREIAVRTALGASRARILRQLLVESLTLSAAGGALGLAAAALFTGWAQQWVAGAIATAPRVAPDWRVGAFALAVSLASGLLFGLAPAIQTLRGAAGSARSGGGASSREATPLRAALVVAQVALSLVLLIGAGLLLRSFVTLMAEETGYDPAGLLTLRLSATESDYAELAGMVDFYDRLEERILAQSGASAVGRVNRLPLGGSRSCDWFHMEGWEPVSPGEGECAEERVVSAGYFETMGIRLLAGRWFDERDTADGEQVVVVSETMAARYIGDRDPIGAGFKWGGHDDAPYRRVIGVVEDVKHASLDAPPLPEVYMPHPQYPFYRTMFVAVRVGGDAGAAIGDVRRALAEVGPGIPVFDVATMQERMGDSILGRRIAMVALGSFAMIAVLLAGIGLYGVLAYTVAQRSREIGIRMALGARAQEVTGLVLQRGLVLTVVGIAAGTGGWFFVAGLIRSLLYGVEPTDPATLGATAAVVAAVATAACWLPAVRATRVDPAVALRE